MSQTTPLYRPIGLYELVAIIRADYREFPPRLPEQPIFYPVLNEPYAVEIASKWNPGDPNSGFSGFVTRFRLPDAYLARFEVHTVGATHHRELWVPAENLAEFNDRLTTPIEVIAGFIGPRFSELVPGLEIAQGPIARDDDALHRLLDHVTRYTPPGGPATQASPSKI